MSTAPVPTPFAPTPALVRAKPLKFYAPGIEGQRQQWADETAALKGVTFTAAK